MADAGMIRKQVEARLAELEAIMEPLRTEYDQLRKVAATLADTGAGASTPTARRPARGAGRGKAPAAGARPATPGGGGGGGSRAQQAVALISAQPGVTAAELAQAMGISRNYLYRVLPKLELRGLIRKEGQGYELPPASTGA